MRPDQAEQILNAEVTGVLEKYSVHIKKFQRRFLRCQREFISYWYYKDRPPSPHQLPSKALHLGRDVVRIEKIPQTLSFELYNEKDERVLLLKGSTFGEYKMWSDVLEAKINFLVRRNDDEEEGTEKEEVLETRFLTNTFTMLSLMSEEEIDELANTSLDEIFNPPSLSSPSALSSSSPRRGDNNNSFRPSSSSSSSWALPQGDEDDAKGACNSNKIQTTVEGITKTLELMRDVYRDLCAEVLHDDVGAAGNARVSPKSTSRREKRKRQRLCGHLFQLYYVALESRLVMEVGSVLGEQKLGVDQLLECEEPVPLIMLLFGCLRRLKTFDASTKEAGLAIAKVDDLDAAASLLSYGTSGLESVLVTQATLVASVVSVAIRQVESAWKQEVEALREWWDHPLAADSASVDNRRSSRRYSDPKPLPKLSSSVFVALGDVLGEIQFLSSSFPSSPSPCPSSPAADRQEHTQDQEQQQQVTYLRSKVFTGAVLFLSGQLQTLPMKPVRGPVDEQVVVALIHDMALCRERVRELQERYCDNDAGVEVAGVFLGALERFMTEAAVGAVLDGFLRTDETLRKLLGYLFVHPMWMRGEVTPVLIKMFKVFLETRQASFPAVMHDRFESRALRTFLVLYLRQFLAAYPIRKRFGEEDLLRYMDDENAMREWVDYQGQWCSREARTKQLWILKTIRIFLLMPVSETLGIVSDTLMEMNAHPAVALPLYDLLRYCLKFRADVTSSSECNAVLAVVNKFISQQLSSRPVPPQALSSPFKILLELFPRAGQSHVTGEPWNIDIDAAETRDGSGGGGETLLAITSLVMKNNEKLLASAASAAATAVGDPPAPVATKASGPAGVAAAAASASPDHVAVIRIPGVRGPSSLAIPVESEREEESSGGAAQEEATSEPSRRPPPSPLREEMQEVDEEAASSTTAAPAAAETPALPEPIPVAAATESHADDDEMGDVSVASSNPFDDDDDEDEDEEEKEQPRPQSTGSGGMFGRRAEPAAVVTAAASSSPRAFQRPLSPVADDGKRVLHNPFADDQDDAGADFLAPRRFASGASTVSPRPQAPPPPPVVEAAPRRFGGGGWGEEGPEGGRTVQQTVTRPQMSQQLAPVVAPPQPPPSPQQEHRRSFGRAMVVSQPAVPLRQSLPPPPPPPPQQEQRRSFGGAMLVSESMAVPPRRPPLSPPSQPQPQQEQRRCFGGAMLVAAPPRGGPPPGMPPPPGQRRPDDVAPPQQQQQQTQESRRSFGGKGGAGWWDG